MGDIDNQPVINVYPTEESIWDALEYIRQNKDKLPMWSKQGREFIEQYHDAKLVAQKYLDFWESR